MDDLGSNISPQSTKSKCRWLQVIIFNRTLLKFIHSSYLLRILQINVGMCLAAWKLLPRQIFCRNKFTNVSTEVIVSKLKAMAGFPSLVSRGQLGALWLMTVLPQKMLFCASKNEAIQENCETGSVIPNQLIPNQLLGWIFDVFGMPGTPASQRHV